MSGGAPEVGRNHLDLNPKAGIPLCIEAEVDTKKERSLIIEYKDKCRSCAAATAKACQDFRQGCQQIDFRRHVRKAFSAETVKNRLPVLKWLPKYRLQQLQGDLIAGITVGLTIIPQSLAYAKIAELPPQYGLYTAFMGCFVYVLLGTSRDVNFGPTAVMSLLTAEFAHSIPALATLLAFVCGVIQVAMGVFSLGILLDYISHPVINSFTTAAAITIACSQVKKWLGLRQIPRGFVKQFYMTLMKLPETKIFDCILGLVCMILLYIMKRMKDVKWSGDSDSVCKAVCKKLVWVISTARNAMVVIFSSGLSAILLYHDIRPFSLTGNIVSGVPSLQPPQFTIKVDENVTMSTSECFENIGIGIVIIPLVGVIESVAIGKAFGRKNGYSIDGNQELLANGFANVLGSFVSAYPVTASFSRSAVMAQSGVQTPLANIFTGTLVLLALAFLTPLFYYIPDAALAAVIIMAVVDMIDFSMIRHLWAINKIDLFPWFATFFISLFAGFEFGILIGVATSLVLLLYPWARPAIKARLLVDSKAEATELMPNENTIVVSIPMGLMFPGVEYLQEKVEAKALTGTSSRTVIVDFTHVFQMDYTAVVGLKEMYLFLQKKQTPLILANVQPPIFVQLQKAKIKGLCCAASVEDAVQMIADGDATTQDDLEKVISKDDSRISSSTNDVTVTHRSVSHVPNCDPELIPNSSSIHFAKL